MTARKHANETVENHCQVRGQQQEVFMWIFKGMCLQTKDLGNKPAASPNNFYCYR